VVTTGAVRGADPPDAIRDAEGGVLWDRVIVGGVHEVCPLANFFRVQLDNPLPPNQCYALGASTRNISSGAT
jgi:hypothetical protein